MLICFVPGGSIFYNGDIVLDPYSEEIIYGSDSNRRRKRATVRNRDNLWKDGIMYFQFDSSIGKCHHKLIILSYRYENKALVQ